MAMWPDIYFNIFGQNWYEMGKINLSCPVLPKPIDSLICAFPFEHHSRGKNILFGNLKSI